MLGASAGDIIGSVYEFDNRKSKDFPLFREDSCFTDDTVLTVALADSILSGRPYVDLLHYSVQREGRQESSSGKPPGLLSQQVLFHFLAGQRRDLLRKAAASELAPIVVEAQGYAGGRKTTQYLETIDKAFHIRGHDRNKLLAVRQILSTPSDLLHAQALMEEVEDSLRELGLSDRQIEEVTQGLDSPCATP